MKLSRLIAMMFFSILLAASAPTFAGEFEDAMQSAIDAQTSATDWQSSIAAAHTFEELTQQHPKEWLPKYWTAHAYSQVALFSRDARFPAYLELAEAYLELASKAYPDKSEIDESEFAVLEANLEGFWVSYHRFQKNSELASQHEANRVAALKRAEKAYPENPRIGTLRGIQLLRDESTREDGRSILAEAVRQFEEFEPASPLHPNWGRPWIDFWLNRISSAGAGSNG